MEVVAELAPRSAPPLRQVTTAVRAPAPEMFASAPAVHPPAPVEPAEDAGFRGRPADLLDAKSPWEGSGSLPQPQRERPVVEPVTASSAAVWHRACAPQSESGVGLVYACPA
jgi:hypothetical protein